MDISQWYAHIFDRHSSRRYSSGYRWPGPGLWTGHAMEHGRSAGRKQRKRRERTKNVMPGEWLLYRELGGRGSKCFEVGNKINY